MAGRLITDDIVPNLREWFDFNCSTGCTPEQLKAALLEAGYREADVDGFLAAQNLRRNALGEGGLYDAEPLATEAAAVARFWARCDVLDVFNRIALGERIVPIQARHLAGGIHFMPGFLSEEECEGLVRHATGSLSASMILNENGVQVRTGSRSSEGARIARGATELVRRVESRIAMLTALPVAHGEDLQLLRYGVGGEYRPHFDYFDPASEGGARELAVRGQRLASVILYLDEVEAGGATLFPELSLAFTPQRGAALLFASLGRQGELLPASLHCGCPVASGEKWIATKWLRLRPHATGT